MQEKEYLKPKMRKLRNGLYVIEGPGCDKHRGVHYSREAAESIMEKFILDSINFKNFNPFDVEAVCRKK